MVLCPTATCTTQIELSISCRNLRNRDLTSRSDPYCVVLLKDTWQNDFVEVGRTEVIRDCLSPEWVKKFVIDYNFQAVQQIRFQIYDHDPEEHDFLGIYETTLAEILSRASRQYVKPLRSLILDGLDLGELVVVATELSDCKQLVTMRFAADNIPTSRLSKTESFLVLSRQNEDGSYSVVYKSRPKQNSNVTEWKPFQLRVRTLCNGHFERSIKLDVYKWKADGQHKLIGSCFSSLAEMTQENARLYPSLIDESGGQLSLEPNAVFRLDKPANAKHPEVESRLVLREIVLVSGEMTFLDYIRSGTQMHFAVAIDLSLSNGPAEDPNSLHYLDPSGTQLNQYEIAIRSIGQVIGQYDSLGMYPSFGFGARESPSEPVLHQFHLNQNSAHPYCVDVESIVSHYRQCVSSVTFGEPTYFSPVISSTANIAARYADGKHYFVLLILCSGKIDDLKETKQAIIAASTQPLSIVIIGIGNAVDLAAMDELDSDKRILSVENAKAERDIVQFVRLNDFLSPTGSRVTSQSELASEVLAEIPQAMTAYMRRRGFKPIPRPLH